jgi:hypothetical protein
MADIFGRHTALQLTLALMMIGSGLCVGAPKNGFPVLILGRAIQGLAAAGINVCCKVIIADKVSLKENAKNTSIFSFFAGMSYAVGPLIGGFLTNSDWRWCFKINLPVAGAGIICVFFILRTQLLGPQPLPELVAQDGGLERTQKFKARILTIDFGGQFLFLFGLGLLILAFTWGGKSYPWSSVHVVVPLVLGALLSLCFVLWQALMAPGKYLSRKLPLQRPTIPWQLLTQRNMALLFYINFATGMGKLSPFKHSRRDTNILLAMSAVLYFVNIYFVFVKGYRPSDAGVQLLFYTPGIGIGVYFAMVMCNFYPRQTFLPLCLGSIIEATGISVLAWALHNGHHVTISFMMGFTGAGTGLRIMPGTLHGIGFFPNNIAAVISMMSFAVPFGSATSMTIMDTVFNNKAGISRSWNFSTTSGVSFFGSLAFIPAGLKQEIIDQIRDAIVLAFVAILPLMWLCVLASFWLGNVRITINKKVDKEGRVDFSENVIEGVFVWSLIRGWLGKEKGGGNEVMEEGNGEENNGEQTPTEVKGMVV